MTSLPILPGQVKGGVVQGLRNQMALEPFAQNRWKVRGSPSQRCEPVGPNKSFPPPVELSNALTFLEELESEVIVEIYIVRSLELKTQKLQVI